jgi:L-rhamnono-1,4-lactonase
MIDSHIHLYELEHLSSLSWMTPRNQLHGQHSVAEYISSTEATGSTKSPQADSRQLSGFIFVEVDRINTPSSKLEGWKDPLQEFSFVASISLGLIPKYAMQSSLVLGIIPWAPIPHGVKAMKEYEAELCALHSEPDKNGVKMPYKVKGFRYLLQSEPRGTMLSDDFIGSLRWMGERGYVFECTIDCNESKIWQLQEVIEMMQRVNRDVQKVEELVQVIISENPSL